MKRKNADTATQIAVRLNPENGIEQTQQDTSDHLKPSRHRWRVTVWVEGFDEDIDAALQAAIEMAKDRYIYVTFGSSQEDGPRIGIRTSRVRKQK